MPLFQSFVGAVRDRVVDVVSQKMEQGLSQGASVAKQLVRKRTHATEDSIGYTWNRETLTGTIHADTAYAYWIETGTRRMEARPFIQPALAEVGRMFGVVAQGRFANLPEQYHESARGHIAKIKGKPRLLVGHGNIIKTR